MEIPASLLMTSGAYGYVVVKGSVHAVDASVFGLGKEEETALEKRFGQRKEIVNGSLLKGSPLQLVNALGQLGYRVVATTGEAEVIWTMQRDL